jgi:MMP 1-O-methyltransferase
MSAALERNDWEVTDAEGGLLRNWARLANAAIVEIGSYRGRSTCFLAEGSHEGHRVPVYAIDLWESGPGYASIAPGHRRPRPYAQRATREAFDDAVRAHGHGLVRPIQGASVEVAATFDEPIGLLHIDGSHATPDVIADVRAWSPKVERGGVIVFHDADKRTVKDGIAATLDKSPRFWNCVHASGRVAAYRRSA